MLCGESGIVINAKSIVPVGVHDASVLKALVVREYKVSTRITSISTMRSTDSR